MTAEITWTVEIAFSGENVGTFRLDHSTLDGDDVLGGFFGQNVFDDISADVVSLRTHRGRGSDLGPIEQGTCVLSLSHPDGKYTPENPTSTFAGLLVPMRPTRIRATHQGTTYGVFYGFNSRIEHDPETQRSVIEAVDLTEWLDRARPVIASTGPTTVGAAIGEIFDYIEWTDPTLRSLETGDDLNDFSDDGGTSRLTLIAELLQIDLGRFFMAGDGRAGVAQAQRQRWARWRTEMGKVAEWRPGRIDASTPRSTRSASLGQGRPSHVGPLVGRDQGCCLVLVPCSQGALHALEAGQGGARKPMKVSKMSHCPSRASRRRSRNFRLRSAETARPRASS